ncbi:MAG: serine/threonine-protein kinase [Gemmatimonadota bacterium]
MSETRWTRIEELFLEALELPRDARAAFLDRVCDDPSVRGEVDAMLAGEDGAAELRVLERLPRMQQGPAAGTLPPGHRLGRYEIVERIGRGGMGEVYRAERIDEQYRQQVALKVLRGDLATPALEARFRAERQILARLQHPNVATLLDGGATMDGRPWLVMQFIDGLPVTTWADEHGLSVPRRLALFATICEAVQYAHTNLVVHRDLKPSNVVVDEDGRPWLLDFGIAKLLADPETEGAAQTRELLLATPEYAAPEQLRGGSITTSTDVYALGILLYELLVGAPPFRLDEPDVLEFHRRVCEEPPTRPSEGVRASSRRIASEQATDIGTLRSTGAARLAQTLKGDLDQIVLTALRKEPGRRYPSAGALAEDIRRYLAGLPVWAQPDSRRYRWRTFVRRHRVGVAAAAAFVVLLGGFAGAMAVQSARLAAERDRVRVALTRAEEVQEFLVSLFDASDPFQEQGRLSAADLLARGAARAEALSDQPDVYADLLVTVGTAYRNLGQFAEAEPLLQRALAVRRDLHGDLHEDVATVEGGLALLHTQQGDYETAEREYRDVRAHFQALFGSGHAQALNASQSIGAIHASRGDHALAVPFFQEVVDHYRGVDLESLDEDAVSAYGNALNNLGLTLVRLGELDRAEPYLRDAVDLNRSVRGDTHPLVATNLNSLATLYFRQGRLEEAAALFQDVLERRRALYGSDHPDVGAPLNNLAQVLSRLGRFEDAEAHAREALEIQRRLQAPGHPTLGLALKNLARLLVQKGDAAAAEAPALEALAVFQAAFGEEHGQVADVRRLLVDVYTALGRPERAAVYAGG